MLLVCLSVFGGQAGQDHRGNGNAKNAQRQLRQTIGIVEPGDAAGRQKRRQYGIEQQVDLTDRNAEQRRHHQRHNASGALMAGSPFGHGQQANLQQERQLQQQLGNTGNGHTPGQRHNRLIKVGR